MVSVRLVLTSIVMAYSKDTSDGDSYDLSSYDRWLQASPSAGPMVTGTCASDVCTASTRTAMTTQPTSCTTATCSVDECCVAAATTREVRTLTASITAGLDFDPATATAEVAAFKAGLFLTLALPAAVTTDMVVLTFTAARRLTSHTAATTSYTVGVVISLPAGVTNDAATTAMGTVSDATLSTNILAAFENASLPVPVLTVTAPTFVASVVTVAITTMAPTADGEDSGAENGSRFIAVAIALVASALA